MATKRKERFALVLGAVDKVSAPIRKINRRIESITKPLSKVRRAMKSLGREAGFQKLGGAVSSLGGQLARMGAAGTAAVTGLFLATKRAADAADAIGKLSAQTGFAAGALQEYEHAAGISGVSSEVFRKSIGALAKRVGELKAGTGSLYTILGKVDPKFRDQVASATSTEEALGLLLEKIDAMPNSLQKNALAAAAFSRAGLSMVNLANQGADGMSKLRAEARATGGVLSDETIAAAEEMNDRFAEMKLAVGGLSKQILADLFPVVREIAVGVRDWAARNHDLIKGNVTGFLRDFVAGTRELIGWLRRVVPPVVEIVQRFGGMKTVLGVVAAVVLAPLAASILAVAAALVSIPGAIIAAVAAIGAGIYAIVDNWETIKTKLFGFVDAITGKIASLARAVIPAPIQALLTAGGALVGAVTPALAGVPSGAAAAPPPPPAPGASESRLRIRVDQDGRVRNVEADQGGAQIDLLAGGVVGSGL